MTLILLLSSVSISFSNDSREIIKAYENGKPAKLDIEVTKVRSDNNIDLFIDRSEKKIYRDITKSTRENSDLDRKLYVTTYLKPNNKTSTINDELPHKIITIDGKRYLEISYFEEPKNIYLWVVKNNKVENLYTGTLKTIPIYKYYTSNFYADAINISNESFHFKFTKGSNIPTFGSNWSNGKGNVLGPWITPGNSVGSLKITIDSEEFNSRNRNSLNIPIDKGESPQINADIGNFNIKYKLNTNFFEYTITPKSSNLKTVKTTFDYSTSESNPSDIKHKDILIINFGFGIKSTSMDFGVFNKTQGAEAESKISIFNSGGLSYKISIPDKCLIYKISRNETAINVFLNAPSQTTDNNFIIKGVIPKLENSEYIEGDYRGTFPVTVTATENPTGGRF
ncbi:hypothetical protein HMPREF0202_01125 [Cetobacterium somerae ATCC BAA-474]|uniref:Uncharacterized protein n=2 Tax=Cetobacterium TaxID=180162 RepID=U7VDR7_9FUSO|nr:hypothetical protein HMPREF0202_01125 [Cetobacterium somerae ATCC BAA-474]